MSKNNFKPDHWFNLGEQSPTTREKLSKKSKTPQEILAPFYPAQKDNPNLLMQQYFVPGWHGESLISKNVKDFKCLLEQLKRDAKEALLKKPFPKKHIQSFFDEFIAFAEFMNEPSCHISSSQQLWAELKNENSEYQALLNVFTDILSYRIAAIFILKARFIVTLNQKNKTKIKIKDIVYPTSYLNRIFKSASSTELKSKAFEQSIYSWYRPSEAINLGLQNFCCYGHELSITDIVKTISIESENILLTKADYSHTLSHKHFGLFLNNLLINFPIWIESLKKQNNKGFCTLNNLEIISCKYVGDFLESLSLSHWLAQEENRHEKWDQILCPDFVDTSFQHGIFTSIVNELQFLSFLTEISLDQGWDPKNYISSVINSHLYNRIEMPGRQRLLPASESIEHEHTYDRLIINLNHYPKNNPHHYIFNQLNKQLSSLKEDGFLYLFSKKKLFISSQKNKIESLLVDLKLEGIFNLEEIKGKGEIGNYLYIFRRRNNIIAEYNQKNTCYFFRISAELDTFQSFFKITNLTQNFFVSNLKDAPPLYQKYLETFKFEFYQDAIVNGQLIHSSTKDTKNITHPYFFERLMKICQPLDYFYNIKEVKFNESQAIEEGSLFSFSSSFDPELAPLCFVVDKRKKDNIQVKLVESDQLESISYEYGHVLCSYFYASPKWNNLNNHTMAHFFKSNIGQQIIHLTFSNDLRKSKGNLKKLLIPSFFAHSPEIPRHIREGLGYFFQPAEALLAIHPSELLKDYNQTLEMLRNLAEKYPADVLALLAKFKLNLRKCIDILGINEKKTSVSYSNPLFKTPLVLAKKYPIFPDNEDIYIEFNSDSKKDIYSTLSRVKKVKSEEQCLIELYSEDLKVLSLYSEDAMINFLDFLISSMKGFPISQIVQSIEVPRLSDLKSIFESYQAQVKSFEELTDKVPEDFDQVLSATIFSGK